MQPVNYESLYEEYEDDRLIRKMENYALWTIPSAFPYRYSKTVDNRGNMDIEHDYQSMGAILVNNLAAKLAGILFPTSQSFFKINPTELLSRYAQQAFAVKQEEVRSKLVELENAACKQLFVNAEYAQLIQAMRYLIITGNCLLKRMNSKTVVYSLRNYVMLRDNEGTILDKIVKECRTYGSLPEEIKPYVNKTGRKDTDEVTVYTRIHRKVNPDTKKVFFEVSQQVEGINVGQASTYPEHMCPYIAVVWNHVNGDSYGRGHVEDHAGDFAKLSDLSKALAIYEIDACKVTNLVKPGATADLESLEASENGEWVYADPDAVTAHEGGDYNKIKQIQDDLAVIFQRLSMAFMYQGNVRDAERVTAEEIKQNAQEAEKTLGGVYSTLSAGLHLPLAYLLTQEVEPMFITGVLAGEISLEVITGVNALGRASEIQLILQAISELAAIIPVMKQLTPRFDIERVIDMFLQARGVNLKDVMLSPEALKQQQATTQAALAQADPLANVQATQEVL